MKNKTSAVQLKDAMVRWNEMNKMRVKESSYNRYRYLIDSNIGPYLGELYISDLTTERMQEYIHFLLNGTNKKRPLAPKTVRDTITVIKQILRFAKGMGAEAPCDFSALSVRMEKVELRVFSPSEYQRLINYLGQSDQLVDAGILLALFTGLRIGEICALTWENINIEEKYIIVRYTMQRVQDKSEKATRRTRVVISTPKSYASKRVIPIPNFLASYIAKFYTEDKAFFLTGKCNRFFEPRNLENHFKRLLAALQIEKASFHALRHTFATRCVESQFDVKSLSEILGHSSVTITLNRYVHPSLEAKRRQMDRLEDEFWDT